MPELVPAGGAVDGGGFVESLRNRLHRGQEEYHVKARCLPNHHRSNGRAHSAGIADPHRNALIAKELEEPLQPQHLQERGENPNRRVINIAPQHTNRDHRDDLGKEKGDAEEFPKADTLADHKGQKQAQRNNNQGQKEQVLQIMPERIPEKLIIDHTLVVLQPDKLLVGAYPLPTGQRVIHRTPIGIDHKDQIEDHRRRQKWDDDMIFILVHAFADPCQERHSMVGEIERVSD